MKKKIKARLKKKSPLLGETTPPPNSKRAVPNTTWLSKWDERRCQEMRRWNERERQTCSWSSKEEEEEEEEKTGEPDAEK